MRVPIAAWNPETTAGQRAAWWAWVVGMGGSIALDVYLVLGLGVESISNRVWDATAAHPTLIAAGSFAAVGVAMLVRHWRWMVFFTGVMAGHLFVHM